MARRSKNPLTNQKEIAANQRGQITKYQQIRFGGIFFEKKQLWFGIALFGIFSSVSIFVGFIAAIREFILGRSDSFLTPIMFLFISIGLFSLMFLPSTLTYLRWHRLERNLSHEDIAQGEGLVTWKRRRYIVMLINGRRLDTIFSPDLLPGRYRFYYLARYHWLLSAEALEEVSRVNDLQQLNHRLAQANHFEPTALDTNRAGQLTGSQKVMILSRFAVYFVVGFTILVLFTIYYIRTNDFLETLWLFIAIVIGIIAFTFYMERKNLSAIADCLQGHVLMVEGPVKKDLDVATDNSVTYYYKLNKTYFFVNEAGYEALVGGLTYRLYLLPRSQKLVNIEVMADAS
jgi:hypothetical protein